MPIEYFLKSKHRRVIHPATSDLLESLLVMLQEKGEDETFRYIKNLLKAQKSKNNVTAIKN